MGEVAYSTGMRSSCLMVSLLSIVFLPLFDTLLSVYREIGCLRTVCFWEVGCWWNIPGQERYGDFKFWVDCNTACLDVGGGVTLAFVERFLELSPKDELSISELLLPFSKNRGAGFSNSSLILIIAILNLCISKYLIQKQLIVSHLAQPIRSVHFA